MSRPDERVDRWSPFAMRPVVAVAFAMAAAGICGVLACGRIGSRTLCKCKGDAAGVAAVQSLIDSHGGNTRWEAQPVLAWRSPVGVFQVWDRRQDILQFSSDAITVTRNRSDTVVFDSNSDEWVVRGEEAESVSNTAICEFYANAVVTFLPYVLCDDKAVIEGVEAAVSSDGEIRLRFSGADLERAGFNSGVVTIDTAHWRITSVELKGPRPVKVRYARWQQVGGIVAGVILGYDHEFGVQVFDGRGQDLMVVGRVGAHDHEKR